jgi:hypothetical protein
MKEAEKKIIPSIPLDDDLSCSLVLKQEHRAIIKTQENGD